MKRSPWTFQPSQPLPSTTMNRDNVMTSNSDSSDKTKDTDITQKLIDFCREMSPAEQEALYNELQMRRGGKERRKSPRAVFFMNVEVQAGDESFSGYAKNLSTAGIFVCTQEVFLEGDEVVLKFCLPESDQKIEIGGKVIRTAQDGIAVGFNRSLKELMC